MHVDKITMKDRINIKMLRESKLTTIKITQNKSLL